VFYFWQPVSRSGPVPRSGRFSFAPDHLLSATPETRHAEIVISEYSLLSPMHLAAAIVHELAHIAGAPGATDAEAEEALAQRGADPATYRRLIAAEEALRRCMLGQMFDPSLLGVIDDIERHEHSVRRVIS
jgi:hypothetical protein